MTGRRLQVVLVVLPAALGLAAWLAFRYELVPDLVLYLRANLGFLLLLAGLLLSVLLGAGVGLYWVLNARTARSVDEIREHSNSQHRQFLRRLDHELKNPLTTLQVDLANLSDQSSDLPASFAGGPLVRIQAEVTRLNEMVMQLRKLADLQTGLVETGPVRLDELLQDLVIEFSTRRPGITLNVPSMPWPLPEVRGDADLLYLALRNTLSNAVKFTRPEDAVQVRAFEDTGHIVVEVADEGPGIPDDEMPYVLEELYRGKNARGLPGSGLGLALVRTIVERHGGKLTLRSRVNRGTVIALRLPRA